MAIWRTISGAVGLGVAGFLVGGFVLSTPFGFGVVPISTAVGVGVGAAIGRWRDKVAEAKEARSEPTRTDKLLEKARDRKKRFDELVEWAIRKGATFEELGKMKQMHDNYVDAGNFDDARSIRNTIKDLVEKGRKTITYGALLGVGLEGIGKIGEVGARISPEDLQKIKSTGGTHLGGQETKPKRTCKSEGESCDKNKECCDNKCTAGNCGGGEFSVLDKEFWEEKVGNAFRLDLPLIN